MKIAIGSDHAGFELKEEIRTELAAGGHEVCDWGARGTESVDYPDFAKKVCRAVVSKQSEVGLLVCGTGLGMAIAANKVPGIRAVACSDTFSARMGREHNDANVLCLGSRVVGSGLAMDIVRAFIGAKFQGGRHGRRVQKILDLESEFSGGMKDV
ncbi:MAG: ribose 5-phosphate isomerase B [Bacillota bacterium]|jgi:ribose 5-phosphate isomerase B